MKSDLNMPVEVDRRPTPQPIRLSYRRDGSPLPSVAQVDLRLPQFQFMVSLSSPWMRDVGASAMRAADVAPTPVALPPPSPSLDGWLRGSMADEVWLDPALRGWATATFVRLYVLGCDGLFALHKLLGTSQFKIGLTEQKVEARIRELNRDSYASHYVGVAGWTGAEGFCDWHPKTPVVGQMPSPASPVVVMSDCIGIHLPECLSLRDFDRALAQHLEFVYRPMVSSPRDCEGTHAKKCRSGRRPSRDVGDRWWDRPCRGGPRTVLFPSAQRVRSARCNRRTHHSARSPASKHE